MTPTEARSLKAGDDVLYNGTSATVIHVRKNGVTVGYWGKDCYSLSRYFSHRVAAAYLERKPCVA